MSQSLRRTRRQFLATASAAAGAMAAPYFVPATAFGANERIVTGHIGMGGQGRGNLSGFMGKASPAAVCDVDKNHLARAAEIVKKRLGKVDMYSDYRKMLEDKSIDAVVISTPDHWHALPTIHACQAGKHVYCEKPLTLTIGEGRKMVEAARANKVVVQTGSQQRSSSNFRQGCELVRNGAIGKVEKVLVGIAGVNFKGPPVPDSDPPPELDYDMWLGPAPERPYNKKRVHYNFRFFWDYSGGQMTNWGAHHIDIAQWGLGTDDTGPVSTEGWAKFHPKRWYEVSMACRVTHTYANGVKLIVGQGEKDIPGGTTFIGSKGKIHVNRGRLSSDPADILKSPETTGDVKLYVSSDHKGDFLKCIKSGERPVCDVEIGHRSATVCHLGNIAIRLGRKIEWDPKNEKFIDDSDATSMAHKPYRAPWKLPS